MQGTNVGRMASIGIRRNREGKKEKSLIDVEVTFRLH